MSTPKKNSAKSDPVAQAKAALAEAEELVRRREAEREAAEMVADELEARLAGGDESVTGADLAAASFEPRRAEVLLRVAKAAVQKAKTNLDCVLAAQFPTVAEFVAEQIRANAASFGLFNVPVQVGPEPSGPVDAPCLYVSQRTPTVNHGGELAAEAFLTLCLPEGARFDSGLVIQGVNELHRTGVLFAESRGHALRHASGFRLQYRFSKIRPELPPMTETVSKGALDRLAKMVAAAVVRAGGTYRTQRVGREVEFGLMVGDGVRTVNRLGVSRPTGRLVDQQVQGDVIARTVDFQATVKPEAAPYVLEQAAQELAGEFVQGVGRIATVDLAMTRQREPGRAAEAEQPAGPVEVRGTVVLRARLADA